MKAGSFKNVIPPIAVYAGAGQPYKTSLSTLQKNITQQNDLNNTHGGSISKSRSRKRILERKSNYYGGSPASVDRPSEVIIPQAPTNGANPTGPNNGNAIAAGASETLMKHFVNSQFDSKVVVPPIPQTGGRTVPLLKRLERLTKKRRRPLNKKFKRTRRHKKHYRKKK